MIDWTPYIIAGIMSVPGYLTVWLAKQNRNDARQQAKRLEAAQEKLAEVHDLVNSQSEKLQRALVSTAVAETAISVRRDMEAEQQASIGAATPQDKPPSISVTLGTVEKEK